MKNLLTALAFTMIISAAQAQDPDKNFYYEQAFTELEAMLEGQIEPSFKRAVFVTENAYLDNSLDYKRFLDQIGLLAHFSRRIAKDGTGLDYSESDIEDVRKKFAVYSVMKDSVPFVIDLEGDSAVGFDTVPFVYDFEDFFGDKDWTKMFVTKLLDTHSGNCHSLPFLYKIIAEEIGTQAHLAMSPNHTYIKQWTEKTGWFNTELTSGQFPIDSWIMASGYIKLEAIQNRVYMDTLSSKQSIAVTLTDLAQGYQKKYGQRYDDDFVLKCLDLALTHYPNYANALILRAEIFKSQYEELMQKHHADSPTDLWYYDPHAKKLFDDLQGQYMHIHRLGYRQMPKEMYLNWLMDIEEKDTDKKLERYAFEAPQPFKELGHEVKVTTLSKGKYQEFFDLDSLTQIGSVVMNRLTGQITHFIEYDTVYSEATLEPEVISRWLSPDPLADERYDWSPYNFVRNNPIIFVDPDGMLDQYYGIVNDELVFLGDDGQGDKVRLVKEGRHEQAVSNLNGENTTDAQRETLRNGDISQVVTFNEGNIQSEFQAANDRTVSRGLENSVVVTLDPSTATVDAEAGAEGTNTNVSNSFNTYGSDGLWTSDGSKLVVGVGHGHPTITQGGKRNAPGYSADDSQTAGQSSAASYSMDSYQTRQGGAATIHQAKPGGRSGRNPVGTTQNTNNIGRTSFLYTAKPYIIR